MEPNRQFPSPDPRVPVPNPDPAYNQPQHPSNPPAAKNPSKIKKFKKRHMLPLLAILIIVLGIGAGVGYANYAKLKKENAKLSNPQEAAQAETVRLKAEVSKIMELPAEEPTIATVVDADASRRNNQMLFADSKNGDKVFIFVQAKKFLLYRPSTKKIVGFAYPISTSDNKPGGASGAQLPSPLDTKSNTSR